MYVSDCIQILILGYGLGSIPFGVLLAKLFHLPDPRYIGSGNIGATNMLRTGNKKVALLTLLLDEGKGALAVIATNQLNPIPMVTSCVTLLTPCEGALYNPHYAALAVLAAAIGHMYSPWLKFKGGKGVATLFGGALAFSWPVGMAAFFLWLIVMFMTRYVSLASIAALAVAPFIAWLRVDREIANHELLRTLPETGGFPLCAIILAIASGIAIWKHRENIKRLRQGFEPRMKFGKGER